MNTNSNPNALTELCDAEQAMAHKPKEDEFEWTIDNEVLFLLSMFGGVRPVGVNRHFTMLLIHDKFTKYMKLQISCKTLWDKLDQLYNIDVLNESQFIPFPNEEKDFELPEYCYDILETKYGVSLKSSHVKRESASKSKNPKKVIAAKPKQARFPVHPKTRFRTPFSKKPFKKHTGVKRNESESHKETNEIESDKYLKSVPESSSHIRKGQNVKTSSDDDLVKKNLLKCEEKEYEIIPFTIEEKDFELPEFCYDILKRKYGVSLKSSDVQNESSSKSKLPKKIIAAKPKQASIPVCSKTRFGTRFSMKPLIKHTGVKKNVSESEKETNEIESDKYLKSFPKSSSHIRKGQNVETSSDDGLVKKNLPKCAENEYEIIPFPNGKKDFDLPQFCYDILKRKYGVSVKSSHIQNDSATKSKLPKKDITPKPKQARFPVRPRARLGTCFSKKPLKKHPCAKKNESESKEETNEIEYDKYLKSFPKSSSYIRKGQNVETSSDEHLIKKNLLKCAEDEVKKSGILITKLEYFKKTLKELAEVGPKACVVMKNLTALEVEELKNGPAVR